MSNYSYKVTNEELFNKTVNDVNTSMLTGSDSGAFAEGMLSIELPNGETKDIQGEHDANDYEDEFGFVLV